MSNDSNQNFNQEEKKMTEQTDKDAANAASGTGVAAPQPKPQPPIPAQPPVTASPPIPALPKVNPSAKDYKPVQAPGWRFDRPNPGTLADVSKVVNSRVLDESKIYKGPIHKKLAPSNRNKDKKGFASNTVQGPASIVELARALKNDPQLIYEWVYNNIEWEPGWGVQKGAVGTILDGCGNSFDQSTLLVELLREAGFTATYVMGQIELTEAQYDDWFNTVHAWAAYWYAQYANIPGNTPVWNGTTYTMVMSHVWVEVVVGGNTYSLDPSYKQYTRKAPVSGLDTILGYNQTTFLSNATSGATVTTDYVQNMNGSNINADLTTMTANLVSYINGNTIGSAAPGTATVDDILGGQEIVPITLPFAWNTSLPYEMVGDTPTRWTTDVPLAYKTTLQVQYPLLAGGGWAIDQTFTSDQLAGGRLTLTFNATLHPVLSLNGVVVATGSEVQTVGVPEYLQLTVNHNAYAFPVYPVTWWQNFIYPDQDKYYLIGNAWGNAGRGAADFHRKELAAAKAAASPVDEEVNGEIMAVIWYNLIAQASRVADLAGRMNNTHMNFFHQVGMVSYDRSGALPIPATDIGGVSGFSSTLDYDFTQLSRTNAVVAMHGVALEAAALAQSNGVKPGVSTTTVIDAANRTSNIVIGGTKTTGDVLTITVHDTALSGGTRAVNYTVLAGDTLTTIATGLTAAINADTVLADLGVTATSTGTRIMVTSMSENQTSYTSSTSGGATETITIAWEKIYKATPSNWTSGANVSAALLANGYTSGDISFLGGYIGTGVDSVVVGDTPGLKLGGWTGDGNWVFPDYAHNGGALGLIATFAKGGQGQAGGDTGGSSGDSSSAGGSGGSPTDVDPVGLYSGNYFYNHNDLSVGTQGFPYELTFGRFYSSANQYVSGPMGRGWQHNFDITAVKNSDGYLAMGEFLANQGAATITELFVSMDIAAASSQPIERLVTMSLSDRWWIDQLVNNVVVIRLPSGPRVFLKQPDGSYTAPIQFVSKLSLNSGLYRLKMLDGVEMNFNSDGTIDTWVHPNGMTLSFGYSSGLLSTVSNGLGSTRTLTLGYTSGHLTSVSDGNGRSVSFTYDTDGNLIGFADANSKVFTYEYDRPGRMTKYFKPAFPATPIVTNSYDSLSRVKEQLDVDGNLWSFFLARSRAEVTNPNGKSAITYLNGLGSPLRAIDQIGYTWSYKYDGRNRLVLFTAPEGNAKSFEYDLNDMLTQSTTRPKPGSGLSNAVLVYTYDPLWNKVQSALDGNGQTTTFTYDATTGNIISIQLPVVGGMSPQTDFTYNSRGQIETITDPTGIVTKFNYDSGTEVLLSAILDYGAGKLNLTENFGYDGVGNLTLLKDRRSNSARNVFDANRKLIQVTGPAPFNIVVNIYYDNNGNAVRLERQTDNPSKPWQTAEVEYDAGGLVLSRTDPNGKKVSFMYDSMRRIWKTVDSSGYVITQTYNDINLNYQFLDQIGSVSRTNLYTPNRMLASVTDASGNLTSYTYDGFDRQKKTVYPDSTYRENTTYDGNHNLLVLTMRNGDTITFTFDELNRIASRTPLGAATQTFAYDLAGRLISLSTPTIIGDPTSGTFEYNYDTAGRFYKEGYPDTKLIEHLLDENGNVIKTTYPDGYYVSRIFDELNRLTDIRLNGALTSAITLEYDTLGRRKALTFENGSKSFYSYSTDNHLVNIVHSFVGSEVSLFAGRDNIGQIERSTISDASYTWRPAAAGSTAYATVNSTNQYPSVASAGFSYDGKGNLTGDSVWTYAYNRENMLISASKTGISATYKYDPSLRQIQKDINGTKTNYYYAGLQRLADYDGSGTLLRRFIYATGIDDIALSIDASGTKTFYHQDHQGSVMAVSNAVGSVVSKFAYSPFGECATISSDMHGFTGQRFDFESGLYYYRARHYSPTLGRFLQPDPIGYGNGLNLYAYVHNRPLNATDPMGLADVPVTKIDTGYLYANLIYCPVPQDIGGLPLNDIVPTYHITLALAWFDIVDSKAVQHFATVYGFPESPNHISPAFLDPSAILTFNAVETSQPYGAGDWQTDNLTTDNQKIGMLFGAAVNLQTALEEDKVHYAMEGMYPTSSLEEGPATYMKYGYNSNSAMSKFLSAMGYDWSPDKWCPGWNNPVPVDNRRILAVNNPYGPDPLPWQNWVGPSFNTFTYYTA